jgi:hypothetical protein
MSRRSGNVAAPAPRAVGLFSAVAPIWQTPTAAVLPVVANRSARRPIADPQSLKHENLSTGPKVTPSRMWSDLLVTAPDYGGLRSARMVVADKEDRGGDA